MPGETGTSEHRTSPSRQWFAIGVATVAMIGCYSAILLGLVGGLSGNEGAVLILAVGMAGVPAVFMVLAFVSRHPEPAKATLKAMGLFLLVGLPIALIDLPAGMVGGFGAGAIVTLRLDATSSFRARIWAIALSTGYVLLIGRILPPVGALVGSVLPFLVIGAADSITRRRAARAPQGSR